MMNSYQVLDIQRAFRWFGDEDTTNEMLNTFAMDEHFKAVIEYFHKETMAIKLMGSGDAIYGAFQYFTSFETLSLINEMIEKAFNKDKEKLFRLHLIFLRKCLILHRELEDYLQKPVASPDIKGYVDECLKELKYEVKEIKGEAQPEASCAGCSIF